MDDLDALRHEILVQERFHQVRHPCQGRAELSC